MPKKPSRNQTAATRLEQGVAVIRSFQQRLSSHPGVYRMVNVKDEVLYVGKARNLKARVASYTRPAQLPIRLQRMISETAKMEFTVTQSEAEALLLEAVLIKDYMPRYNVLLRDDKSFPFIHISGDHAFPRIAKHRGPHKAKGEYFGPYMTSNGAVDQTITALQRAFLIRNCSDSIFSARQRPCLQYHIKRCSAPCVGYIAEKEYGQSVRLVKDFLRGKSGEVQQQFAEKMNQASSDMDYESAAQYRDRIRALSIIQSKQRVHVQGLGDLDVMAAVEKSGKVCVQVFSYRDGLHLGNHAWFPKTHDDQNLAQTLSAFMLQFYQNQPIPKEIATYPAPSEAALIARALSIKAGHKVVLSSPTRGKKREIVDHVLKNAKEHIDRTLAESATQQDLLRQLRETFDLPKIPGRIEIYDNSHIQGKQAVGAMVVATAEGFAKKSYRKFNIRFDNLKTAGGDDYFMLRQVLDRRFSRMHGEDSTDSSFVKPDLLLIDGGLGQLNTALEIMAEKKILDIPIVAIAKGPDRNAGREKFFMDGREQFQLPPNHPVLHFLQRLRDEAHRFAIGSHRKKRGKEMSQSALDAIPGVGASRKRALLQHFGSAIGVKKASLQDLQTVQGISKALAQKLYSHFHSGAE